MLRIKTFFKPYQKLLIFIFILIFIQAINSLLLPYLMSDIVNIGIQQYGIKGADYLTKKTELITSGIDIASVQRDYILKVGFKMFMVSILQAGVIITIVYIASTIAAAVGKDLRTAMFTKIESFHNDEFNKFSSASLITRCTSDVTQIQNMLVIMIRLGFLAPIMAIGGIIMAFNKSINLSWTIALAVICLIILVIILFKISMPKFKKIQQLVDKLTQTVRQSLSGLMVVRAFNTQKFEFSKFEAVNSELNNTRFFVNKTMLLMPTIILLIMNLTWLIIIWFGAKEIASSAFKVGDMMAYLQFAIQVIMAFIMMSMMFVMVPRASVSANRIADVLDTNSSVKEPSNPITLKDFTGQITFDNVCFAYNEAEANALSNINLTIEAGSTVAIVGSTGSGKTTLMNLITKFYNISSGMIYFDDIAIDALSLKSIRNNVAYVPQKAQLFKGTIKSNLLFANPTISEEDIRKALDTAQASEFIDELENGLDAEVSQGGSNFSGGQKQRLTIARALCKKAPVYLFDDSFSALDFATDKKLREALKEYTNSTIIIVAQRVNSIKEADKIVVLEEGKIASVGKHQELLKHCETYREIALSQDEKELTDEY